MQNIKQHTVIVLGLIAFGLCYGVPAFADTFYGIVSSCVNSGAPDTTCNVTFPPGLDSFDYDLTQGTSNHVDYSGFTQSVQNQIFWHGGSPGSYWYNGYATGTNIFAVGGNNGYTATQSGTLTSSTAVTITSSVGGTFSASGIQITGVTCHLGGSVIACPVINPITNAGIFFTYPQQSSTIAQFSPWLLQATGLASNQSYLARVNWYAVNPDGSLTTTLTNGTFGTGLQLMQNGISIPRTQFNFDLATSTVWHATAQILSSQDPNNPNADLANPIVIASSSISFTVQSIPQSNNQFTVPQFLYSATGTILGIQNATTTVSSQVLISSSTQQECSAPNSLFGIISSPGADVAYAGCVTSHFLFDPDPAAQFNLGVQLQNLQATPPISIFFQYQTALNNEVASSSLSSSSVQYQALMFNQSTTFLGNTPIMLLSSSSLASFIGIDAKNQLFAILNAGLTLLGGVYVVIRIHGKFAKNQHHMGNFQQK